MLYIYIYMDPIFVTPYPIGGIYAIYGAPWIPSIYPIYVSINIAAPAGSVMGNAVLNAVYAYGVPCCTFQMNEHEWTWMKHQPMPNRNFNWKVRNRWKTPASKCLLKYLTPPVEAGRFAALPSSHAFPRADDFYRASQGQSPRGWSIHGSEFPRAGTWGAPTGGKLGWMPISARQDLTSFIGSSPEGRKKLAPFFGWSRDRHCPASKWATSSLLRTNPQSTAKITTRIQILGSRHRLNQFWSASGVWFPSFDLVA